MKCFPLLSQIGELNMSKVLVASLVIVGLSAVLFRQPIVVVSQSVPLEKRIAALETRVYVLEQAGVTPSPVAIATLTEDESTTYVVKANDTIASIAKAHGITIEDIMVGNGLVDANFLFSGQKIRIPNEAVAPVATFTPATVPVATSTPLPVATIANPSEPDYEITRIEGKVTESNDIFEKNAWVMEVKNNGDQALLIDATIDFEDADGFIVSQDYKFDLYIGANETKEFTGVVLIPLESSMNVANIAVNTTATVTQ